jgi:hypothetical protein
MRGVVPILAVIGAKNAGKRVREKKAAPVHGEERTETGFRGLIIPQSRAQKGTHDGMK